MTLMSQMEIQNILSKIDNSGLSLSEYRVLSALISWMNKDTRISFPSTDLLMKRTGLSDSGIERARKSLKEAGWLDYSSGKGKGNSNKYFVNCAKIVQMAKQSGATVSDNKIPTFTNIDTKEQHKRNISGLVQNKPKTVYKDYGNTPDDEEDCPF